MKSNRTLCKFILLNFLIFNPPFNLRIEYMNNIPKTWNQIEICASSFCYTFKPLVTTFLECHLNMTWIYLRWRCCSVGWVELCFYHWKWELSDCYVSCWDWNYCEIHCLCRKGWLSLDICFPCWTGMVTYKRIPTINDCSKAMLEISLHNLLPKIDQAGLEHVEFPKQLERRKN